MIIRSSRTGSIEEINPPFDQYFMKALNVPTTVSTLGVVDEYTVVLTSATNFSPGDIIFLASGSRFYTGGIISIATNTLTLDTPLDFAYPVGSIALPMTNDLAVDGSSTRQVFKIESGTGLVIDIHRILVTMLDSSAMDDGLFGGLSALTNGLVLRLANGTYRNIANAKKNGDFRVFAYDVEYIDKAPSGQYGLGVRFTFGGNSKHGTVLRLNPGDSLDVIVQDNLTGLDELLVTAQGHIVKELA